MSDIRDSRRAEIVAAARQLVGEEGLEALTFGRLEKRLPYTRGVITHHFDSRDDIVDAVLESAVEEVDRATREQVVRGMSVEARIQAVLTTKVQGFLTHPEATHILLSFGTRAGFDPRGRRVNQRLMERYRTEARALFGDHDDADALAAWIVGTVVGIVMQAQLDPDGVDPTQTVNVAARGIAAGWAR